MPEETSKIELSDCIDSHRVELIRFELDRYMGQHKISMNEVLKAVSELYLEWDRKGCIEPEECQRYKRRY